MRLTFLSGMLFLDMAGNSAVGLEFRGHASLSQPDGVSTPPVPRHVVWEFSLVSQRGATGARRMW